MGDRANCIVMQNAFNEDHPPVWLYTHWGGYNLPQAVQKAMQRKERWDDPAYLTRIIFDVMTEGQHGGETGFGISTSMCDNEHDLIVVDPGKKQVRLESPNDRSVLKQWSFEEFCTADLTVTEDA